MSFKRWRSDEEIELKDCPFCGTKPKGVHIGNEHTKKISIEIKCPGCRVKMKNSALSHGFEWLENISAENWNKRVII